MIHGPDFIIIGAMKCATSTLHEQLARQPGIFMSDPKEPNFFSNDEIYAKGLSWYESLFPQAEASAPAQGSGTTLRGESSTHYTKLPTYPRTVERMSRALPDARLVYVMRHPVERLVSQYIHEWTQRNISTDIDEAVDRHPELVAYSRYAMQLEPYREAYGAEGVLPVFFEEVIARPRETLERVCRFVGYAGTPRWESSAGAANVSRERLRQSPLRDAVVDHPWVTFVRRRFIPKSVREWVKKPWRMEKRPELSPESVARLKEVFDEDLAILGGWLGMELDCDRFKERVLAWASRQSA